MRIFASIMTVDDSDLPNVIEKIGGCVDGFHVDIMDGEFVPYKKGSYETVYRLWDFTELPVWTHLMVKRPHEWLKRLETRRGDIISIHYESYSKEENIKNDLCYIRDKNMFASLACSPETSMVALQPFYAYMDQVLLMGVTPGRSGQPMREGTKSRMKELYTMRAGAQDKFRIGLDGGVTPHSLSSLFPYVPEDSAAATSIISAKDPLEAVTMLRRAAEVRSP